ncbi:hypothetical protein SAY87_012111 [Trapa incisa]|uniref:Uncharacterized protein n=1 Tax=Trapa incisa TaxID=236973 RepID=A0AAN7GXF1_9MYRT|nr:hypothetical protein SAY87_012111 [Trapa incisa]
MLPWLVDFFPNVAMHFRELVRMITQKIRVIVSLSEEEERISKGKRDRRRPRRSSGKAGSASDCSIVCSDGGERGNWRVRKKFLKVGGGHRSGRDEVATGEVFGPSRCPINNGRRQVRFRPIGAPHAIGEGFSGALFGIFQVTSIASHAYGLHFHPYNSWKFCTQAPNEPGIAFSGPWEWEEGDYRPTWHSSRP